jgi:hypothetical protein
MTRRFRLITVLMQLVAFGVTGLLPAAGSWSCPDGTACVYTAGQGFHCLGEQCQMACCEATKPARGCGRCDHDALPGVGTAARTRGHAVGEPEHCRYRDGQQLEPFAVPDRFAPELQWHVAADLPAPVEVPIAAHLWQRLAPIRGSPPPSHTSPSASPRAPPGSDCA